ncbi:MAG: putative DsbA family dithiol-disulfide isomerase [Sphingobacteriales bacterium]|jgi:predicted DsbA family dithiol-disulfide isomerase
MKVEIWSDVMCPFCYIGKKRFENALSQFENAGEVEVEWKSYQLNPALETQPEINATEHLAKSKGWTLEYTKEAQANVVQMAKGEGLEFDFTKTVVANSFMAHRLTHYAKTMGKQLELEEKLFESYFVLGQNIDDPMVLKMLTSKIGLPIKEVEDVLNSQAYAEDVEKDIYESKQFGVQGVPYYVIDGKYGLSGAQESSTFLKALNQVWEKDYNNEASKA